MAERPPEQSEAWRRLGGELEFISRYCPDVLVIMGPGGSWDWVSESVERAFGRPREEVEGVDGFQWVHPDDLGKMQRAYDDAYESMATGEVRQETLRVAHADGGYIHVDARGRAVRDEDGGLRCWVVSLRPEAERLTVYLEPDS